MSRRAATALVALGLFAVAAIAAPYVFGMRIESWFEAQIARLPPNPLYRLEIERYERGWRTSHAVTALTLHASPSDQQPVTLRFDSAIEHGPIIGGLRQARITTTPVISPEIAEALGPLFGTQPPLVSVIDIAISGAVDGTLDSPAASEQIRGGSFIGVEWKGLRSHFRLDPGLAKMEFTGEAPGLTISLPSGPPLLQFVGLSLSGSAAKSQTSGMWLGPSTVELGLLAVVDATSGATNRFEQLRMTSSSDEKDGSLQMAVGFTAAAATMREAAVREIAFDLSLHDIDSAAMKKLQEFLETQSAQANPAEPELEQRFMAEVQSLAGEFLARKPWLAIDRLGFVYQDEPFSAQARVQYVGAGNLAAFNPMRDLGGSFRFEAPHSAVQAILETQQRNELMQQLVAQSTASGEFVEPTSDDLAAVDAQAKALAGQRVLEMILRRWIVPAGAGRLKAEAVIENGAILLNGQPFTPPMPAVGEAAP